MQDTEKYTHKICSLDVWGNDEDGYEINNWFTIGFADLESQTLDDVMLEYLKGKPSDYEILEEGSVIHIEFGGKPILQLYKIYE